MDISPWWIALGVYSLFCAIGCGSIASERRRDNTPWFFLGLVSGIIGLIVISAYPPLPGSPHKCPACKGEVPENATRCQHCTSYLTWPGMGVPGTGPNVHERTG